MKPFSLLFLFSSLLLTASVQAQSQSAAITADKLAKINAVAAHAGVLYAATNNGLYQSQDQGKSWRPAVAPGLPATTVNTTADGKLYSFVVGQGLLALDSSSGQWKTVNNQFGSQVLMNLSVDDKASKQMAGLNQYGKIILSDNAGERWHGLRGPYRPGSEAEKRGQALFQKNCQTCHGIDGVGETYTLQALTDQKYLMAPALDASAHAWHHTDDALVKTILEGSSRPSRMPAWKDKGLSEQNARDLVAYMKSLWTQRELDCQGPKHMQCMK